MDRVVLHGGTSTGRRAATLCFRPTISTNSRKSHIIGKQLSYFILIVFIQVWLLLFLTMIAMVFSMSMFSKISLLSNKKNNSQDQPGSIPSKQSMTLLSLASSYLVYVLNIITNQGDNSYCFSLTETFPPFPHFYLEIKSWAFVHRG